MSEVRVVDVVDVGYPFQGGAQITHLTFLRALAARGYPCVYLDRASRRRVVRPGPVRLDFYRDIEELRTKVLRQHPDLLLGALDGLHQIARLGKQHSLPTIGYLNSYEYCPPTVAEGRRWRLSFGKPPPGPAERAFALANLDLVLANSEHLARRLLARTGVQAEVVYPAFESSDFLLDEHDTEAAPYVAGICGYAYKGAEIFLALARRFPRQRFLLVGAVHARYSPEFRALPNVTLLPFGPPKRFLRQSKIFLVPSQWPEPFGRIAVEAMANGIPVLVSRTGGLKEVAPDAELSVGAFRQVEAWESRLGSLLDSPSLRRRFSDRGRWLASRFLRSDSVDRLAELVERLAGAAQPQRQVRPVVALRGRTEARSAYAQINAVLASGLAARGHYEVVSLPAAATFSLRPVDLCILHSYDENFETLTVPDEGKLIAIRSWDFGKFPPAWVEKINQECDQLWVYSRWIKELAVSSGVEPRRVRVIPLGFDERTFGPDGPAYALPTDRTFRFLFVGATIYRKGIDILLKAYGQAFGPQDDVCLVIKDRPGDVFYQGIGYRDEIVARTEDPGYPPLVYLYDQLAPDALAALYRACQVGVFPYRAEGFGLPILEGMACGLPPIVPRFGASLDYCSSGGAFQVPAKRFNLPVRGRLAFNTLGFSTDLEEVDFCEMTVDQLAAAMRAAYRLPREQLIRKSARAVQVAQGCFRWSNTLRRVEQELGRLEHQRVPVRLRRQRTARERELKVFETARSMFLELSSSRAMPIR